MKARDKEYLRELAKDYPALRHYVLIQIPLRFRTFNNKTKCDGPDDCKEQITFDECTLFVTPEPQCKPMLLCRKCIKKVYLQYAGPGGLQGGYDQHIYLLDKTPAK